MGRSKAKDAKRADARRPGATSVPMTGLEKIPKPELFFAFVGAVGSDLQLLSKALEQELLRVGYKSSTVRLSGLLKQIAQYEDIPEAPKDKRYHAYMTAGNGFREDTRRGDAMALLGVAAVRNLRKALTGSEFEPDHHGRAYLIRSLKHTDEVETLRRIYGREFYLIAAYSRKKSRLDGLSKEIAESYFDSDTDKYRGAAERLNHRDEQEILNRFGQNVRHTFPMADVFVSLDKQGVSHSIRQFVELIFGNQFITPNKDELGMFFARAAALRSADLSRQVGAAIMSDDGEVITVGCNEVPKAGGGMYWSGDADDARDFQQGGDAGARIKRSILGEILHLLRGAGWLNDEKSNTEIDKLVDQALGGQTPNPLLRGAQLMSILEFGRMVHGEMAALSEAACRGHAVAGATLYTTTFPCHICARHIVASGIKRVVYIEPYAKSRARELYPDSISVDGEDARDPSVRFEPFVGVSPNRFIELFQATDRKLSDGRVKPWSATTAVPRLERLVSSYVSVEDGALAVLRKAVKENVVRPFADLPKVPDEPGFSKSLQGEEHHHGAGSIGLAGTAAGHGGAAGSEMARVATKRAARVGDRKSARHR
jgi:cytidine deaminase